MIPPFSHMGWCMVDSCNFNSEGQQHFKSSPLDYKTKTIVKYSLIFLSAQRIYCLLIYSSAKIFYLHLNPLNMGFVEQIVSPVISTYAKGDRLTNQSAIQCLCGFTAFHSHVSRIWLRNYS